MGRPRGYRINPAALHDLLKAKRMTMTDAATRSGLSLTTISGLAQLDHNASIKTCERLALGIDCSAETLFPELASFADAASAAVAS